MRFAAAVILALVLWSCRTSPIFPVPDQSPSFKNFKARQTRVVDFARAGGEAHIVRDILGDSSLPWRWTLQRPAVKVKIGFNRDLKYVIDFALPNATFQYTGPVTIAFTIDDHVLDRVRYTTPGPQHYANAVPPDWLQPHTDVIAGAEIDKVWVSKDDGARLGFIVSRLGLVEK